MRSEGDEMRLVRLIVPISMFLSAMSFGATTPGLQTWTLTVDGVERTALIYVPKPSADPAPLVFVFHGHGGSSKYAQRQFHLDTLWPEAISVYPQGLDTPGQLLDASGHMTGWQHAPGQLGDRDLHFFDALLVRLKRDLSVDDHHVFVTGHSNGGTFTYLLWQARPDVFAAVAPCSAAATYAAELTPKPAMISGGTHDPLVRFELTQRMIAAVQKIDHCDVVAQPWQTVAKVYASTSSTPVVAYTYAGTHTMDKAEAGLIVTFFKEFCGSTGKR